MGRSIGCVSPASIVRRFFGALLDADSGGRFRVDLPGTFDTHRRYLPETSILETTFRMSTRSVVLRDLMPVASEAEKRIELAPDHQVLREIQGLDGEVGIEGAAKRIDVFATALHASMDC